MFVSNMPPFSLSAQGGGEGRPYKRRYPLHRIGRALANALFYYNPILLCFAFVPQSLGSLLLELGLIVYCI
jgi:hypothetical protein